MERKLKVFTMDLVRRTLVVRNSKTVEELVEVLCRKVGVPVNRDFGLAFEKVGGQKVDDKEKMTDMQPIARKLTTEGKKISQ